MCSGRCIGQLRHEGMFPALQKALLAGTVLDHSRLWSQRSGCPKHDELCQQTLVDAHMSLVITSKLDSESLVSGKNRKKKKPTFKAWMLLGIFLVPLNSPFQCHVSTRLLLSFHQKWLCDPSLEPYCHTVLGVYWLEWWLSKRYVHPEHVNANLFGKKVFANVIKLNISRWDHSGLPQVVPKSNDKCLYKIRRRYRGHVKEPETGVM